MLTGVFGSGTVGNAKALLVLAGRSISTQTRPSASLVDYFESQNASAGDRIYETRLGVSGSINDRTVLLAP